MSDLDMMGSMPQKPDTREASMARADLYKCANYSFKLFKMIQDGQELEGWVQAKITKAADYIASVYHYMEYEMKFNDYGKKLEDSDVYTEEVKQQFIHKLTEARVKLEKLKERNISDLEEDSKHASRPNNKEYAEKVLARKRAHKAALDKRRENSPPGKGNESEVKEGFDVKNSKGKVVHTAFSQNEAKKKAAELSKEGDKHSVVFKRTSSPKTESAKPDFLDVDKDGNRKEPMKKAIADKKKKA